MQKCSWKVGEKPEFGKLSLNFSYLSASNLSSAMYNFHIGLLFHIELQCRNLHCWIAIYVYTEVEAKADAK